MEWHWVVDSDRIFFDVPRWIPAYFIVWIQKYIFQAVRPAAQAGDKNAEFTPLALFAFFVNRCRENLHIIIAFSPIGDAFRNRMRQFPSLINCCTIDWFQVCTIKRLHHLYTRGGGGYRKPFWTNLILGRYLIYQCFVWLLTILFRKQLLLSIMFTWYHSELYVYRLV